VQIPWDQFEGQIGKEMATMYHWFEDVGYHVNIGEARQDCQNLMSFDHWINANWHSATQTAG
jgi:hypothetical protein